VYAEAPNKQIVHEEIKVKETIHFPSLPLDEWDDTRKTLHLFLQMVGKVRLMTFPRKNHWWHVPLYVSARGLTTGPIPYRGSSFEIEFDFIEHSLRTGHSGGATRSFQLAGLSVASFYDSLFSNLGALGIDVSIKPIPYDVPDIGTEPFNSDEKHAAYDPEYVTRFWRILVGVDGVFQEFRGRFTGKTSPVHLFWHHMDLALTRFSGKRAPERPGAGRVEREAYSHEVISAGFWAGDAQVREPAFYAYAYPPSEGLVDEPIQPEAAFWNAEAGMALLMYNEVRKAPDPKGAILDFLESTYQAGAKRANWDTDAFRLNT
jgi:hypothetical protein